MWQLAVILVICGFYLCYCCFKYLFDRIGDLEWEWKKRKEQYEEQIEARQREIDALRAGHEKY